MSDSQSRGILLSTAAAAMLLASRAIAAEPAPTIEVVVRVYLGVDLQENTLRAAFREVESIYESGGLRFQFEPRGEGQRPGEPVATLVVQSRPPRHVVQGCSRNRHDHRLGHTNLLGRRLTLWTDQIRRAVDGDWDRNPDDPPLVDEGVLARALGRVLAHELGHLLLRLNGHRDGGLMRSSFSHRSLTGRGGRAFRLAPGDLEKIRSAVSRFLESRSRPSSPMGR